MKNFETVNDWIHQVVKSQRGVESVHLNRLNGGKCSQLAGIELIQYVRDILLSVGRQLQTSLTGHGVRQLVAFLPVNVTRELMLWNSEIWYSLTCADEPPSLYAIRDEQIFNDDCEEYRCPVSMPLEDDHGVKAIFRSFRDQDAIDNSWEFTSGVYLIVRLD